MSDRTVLACPECDSATIEIIGDGYYCNGCYTKFEEGVERDPHVESDTRVGLAGELLDADPDEVGGGV